MPNPWKKVNLKEERKKDEELTERVERGSKADAQLSRKDLARAKKLEGNTRAQGKGSKG